MNAINTNRHISTWMLIACGIWLIGLGLYFIALRPPLLPEDPRFMGATLEQIRTAIPGLEGWLKKVFTVMGGFMAGAGAHCIPGKRWHAAAIEGYVMDHRNCRRADCCVDERHQLCVALRFQVGAAGSRIGLVCKPRHPHRWTLTQL